MKISKFYVLLVAALLMPSFAFAEGEAPAASSGSGFSYYTPPFPPNATGSAAVDSSAPANDTGGSGGSSGYNPGYVAGAATAAQTPCLDTVRLDSLNKSMYAAASQITSTQALMTSLPNDITACQANLTTCQSTLASMSLGLNTQAEIDTQTAQCTSVSKNCDSLAAQLVAATAAHDKAVSSHASYLAQINSMYQACGMAMNASPTTGISNGMEDPCGVVALCTMNGINLSMCHNDPQLSCIKRTLNWMMPLSSYECPAVTSSWATARTTCELSASRGGGMF